MYERDGGPPAYVAGFIWRYEADGPPERCGAEKSAETSMNFAAWVSGYLYGTGCCVLLGAMGLLWAELERRRKGVR